MSSTYIHFGTLPSAIAVDSISSYGKVLAGCPYCSRSFTWHLSAACKCATLYFGAVKLSKFQREGGDHACCITAAHGIRIYDNLYEEALAHNAWVANRPLLLCNDGKRQCRVGSRIPKQRTGHHLAKQRMKQRMKQAVWSPWAPHHSAGCCSCWSQRLRFSAWSSSCKSIHLSTAWHSQTICGMSLERLQLLLFVREHSKEYTATDSAFLLKQHQPPVHEISQVHQRSQSQLSLLSEFHLRTRDKRTRCSVVRLQNTWIACLSISHLEMQSFNIPHNVCNSRAFAREWGPTLCMNSFTLGG